MSAQSHGTATAQSRARGDSMSAQSHGTEIGTDSCYLFATLVLSHLWQSATTAERVTMNNTPITHDDALAALAAAKVAAESAWAVAKDAYGAWAVLKDAESDAYEVLQAVTR